MRPSRVDEVGDAVLAALREGVGVRQAAERAGIPERTLRNWLAEGRRQPSGRFAAFADAVDARRVAKLAPVDPDAPLPDRAELLRRLDAQSRNGSTTATAMLLRELPADPAANATAREVMALSLVPRS